MSPIEKFSANPDISKRLLTVAEAGVFVNLGPWCIRRLIYSGQIPYVKIGRRILLDRKDIEEFIEARKTSNHL